MYIVIFCIADMLDNKHLASTVRTILDWHTVNVAGRWILHSVYTIHLDQGIIDFAGMKAQRCSFLNACKSKDCIKSCPPLFKM